MGDRVTENPAYRRRHGPGYKTCGTFLANPVFELDDRASLRQSGAVPDGAVPEAA
ncbi:MAG: hypothetical protein NTY02_01555 [Acidobacteria bacterium]|nr:hypothetical protein [Acidobacteriota bacterium]